MSTYTETGPVLVSELPAVRVPATPGVLARFAERVAASRARRRDLRMLQAACDLGHASASELLAASRRL